MICEITECKEEIMPGVPWCPQHAKEAESLGIIKRKTEFASEVESEQ